MIAVVLEAKRTIVSSAASQQVAARFQPIFAAIVVSEARKTSVADAVNDASSLHH